MWHITCPIHKTQSPSYPSRGVTIKSQFSKWKSRNKQNSKSNNKANINITLTIITNITIHDSWCSRNFHPNKLSHHSLINLSPPLFTKKPMQFPFFLKIWINLPFKDMNLFGRLYPLGNQTWYCYDNNYFPFLFSEQHMSSPLRFSKY